MLDQDDSAVVSTVPVPTFQSQSPEVSHGGPRKRQKVTRACDACKSKKKRCSGEQPCETCWKNGSECAYLSTYTRGHAQAPPRADRFRDGLSPLVNEGRRRESVEQGVARRELSVSTERRSSTIFGPLTPTITDSASLPASVDHVPMQYPTEPSWKQTDLQPVLSTDQAASLLGVADVSARPSRRGSPEAASTNFGGQYHGPTSAHSFLHRAWKRLGQDQAGSNHEIHVDQGDQGVSIFSFGDRSMRDNIPFRMPSRTETRILLARYFDFVMPTYRFLHRQTVAKWLEIMHQEHEGTAPPRLPAARQAIVMLVIATSAIWDVDDEGKEIFNPESDRLTIGDMLFREAKARLAGESGVMTLESVQARLASVLYLVNTSRPNQAWFTFGTTVQLAMALGLHRKPFAISTAKTDFIVQECQKRVIWNCYTLDYYLSVMFGRPRLLHDEDIDQDFPQQVNDEDMTPEGIKPVRSRRDCVLKATIFHARLARIVSRASKEQYALHQTSEKERMAIAKQRNAEIEAWQNELPPFLSGVIQASSLIPVFWRQMTVLRLAHSHALMLVNRPFLLYKAGQEAVAEHVSVCLHSARAVVDVVLGFVQDGHMFPFWYTQYITFNALTIIYVYIIQRKRGRISAMDSIDEETLFIHAETTQQHLAKATRFNAPSMRYSIILDELRQHAQDTIRRSEQQPIDGAFPVDELGNQMAFSPFSMSPDFPLGFDFWPQLDSLPLSNFT